MSVLVLGTIAAILCRCFDPPARNLGLTLLLLDALVIAASR